jgi:hypothetical protein
MIAVRTTGGLVEPSPPVPVSPPLIVAVKHLAGHLHSDHAGVFTTTPDALSRLGYRRTQRTSSCFRLPPHNLPPSAPR